MINEQQERQRLEAISNAWSSTEGIDARMISYTYQTLKPFFVGKTCLELGCADGQMTNYLVQDFEQVVAVDGSKVFIEQLESRNIPNLSLVYSLFEHYEPTERFDVIMMAHILEHVDHPADLLKRVAPWVKEDGVILVDVPNADSLHRLAGVKMGLLERKDSLNEKDHFLGHRRVYTVELMRQHIEGAGLTLKHWGGHFLKTVSNGQMIKSWTSDMMDAYYELGKEFPDNAAEIYFVCTNKR